MITPELLKRLCDARQRLLRDLESPAKVSHLAREAGLSTEHFITQFRAVFGETPLRCRTRARLERAREALLASDEPATQIGLSLGFANAGSFSRLFARHFGMSPRAYRKVGTLDAVPAGCIALMNRALAGGLNFGEVGHDGIGQDGTSMPEGTPHANQPHQHLR